MRYRTVVSERAHRLWLPLCLIAGSAAGFLAIDAYNAGRAAQLAPLALESPLDARIPFVPGFVFAYLLYYPFLLVPLVIVRRADDLQRVIAAFLLMQLTAATVFIALPSCMIRPAFIPEGVAGSILHALYSLDPGWNAFPSLHAGHSVLVALVCWRHRRDLFPAVALGTGLIAVSTVFIKQHYVIDVLGGALLAWACIGAAQARLWYQPRRSCA